MYQAHPHPHAHPHAHPHPHSHPHGAVAPPQSRSVAPETFLLDQEAQQSLPPDAIVALQQVDNLKYFLISAPVDWQPDQYIRRFLLPTGEYVSCVLWNNLFHISGTDIVRCLSFRFQAFGRPVKNSKKFEEGIFSDLRNLKAGTDASLEEPKSAFLDFLYKNNCIRTQKKQKVFYWYSVPHDRLFLDALERDLKREKMGQEATTVAVSEPALSFEFDSSQSLFEQLTKAQQTNSSSFNANMQMFTQHASPVLRAVDPMPPPSMIPPSIPQTIPEEPLHHMAAYGHMGPLAGPPQSMTPTLQKMRERDYAQAQYDRSSVSVSNIPRHSSVPAYLEYSPAPSFVSSHFDEYSTRGMSFEPITPPQSISVGAEPAYIANEDTGLYTAIPDLGLSATMQPMVHLPPSNLMGPQFGTMSRAFAPGNVYSVIEGSPTYKQRRRRSSLSAGVSAAAAAAAAAAAGATGAAALPHAPHRSSDLRRSVSNSVVEELDEKEPDAHHEPDAYGPQIQRQQHHQQQQHRHPGTIPETVDLSRHGSPLATIEQSPPDQSLGASPLPLSHNSHRTPSLPQNGPGEMHQQMGDFPDQTTGQLAQPKPISNLGVFRRARSATMTEAGPYPQKSHACPIPTCGRLFKRLEHLKRHVRTHTHEKPYLCTACNRSFSRSDNLAQHRRIHEAQKNGTSGAQNLEEEPETDESQTDHVKSQDSPGSEATFLPTSTANSISELPVIAGLGGAGISMTPQPQMVVAQNF